MKTRCTEKITEGRETHDFGVADKKGRQVGAIVAFSVQVFEQLPEDATGWQTVPVGTHFCWIGYATRGGDPFGAGRYWNYCATEAERIAAVAKYLKGAKARAVKSFA